jgi:hypothetical protein
VLHLQRTLVVFEDALCLVLVLLLECLVLGDHVVVPDVDLRLDLVGQVGPDFVKMRDLLNCPLLI